MRSLLVLASDFLEHMSNPAYGAQVNDEYALRFADLLESERGELQSRLSSEIRLLDDPEALTPHAWLWLISWARAHEITFNHDLALDLFGRWSSTALRAALVECVTQSWERREPFPEPTIVEFPQPWLQALLKRAIAPPPSADELHHQHRRRVDATGTLLALLQAGSDVALDAAAALLHEDWPGRDPVHQRFQEYLEDLDAEATRVLQRRLRLTPAD